MSFTHFVSSAHRHQDKLSALLYHLYFVLKKKHLIEKEYVFEFTVPLFDPLHPIYYIKVVSDRWLNCEA